jgi:hypothetical protein
MVGHTGMDVPADIRRQMYFIDKQSKKKAVLGYGLTGQPGDNRMKVSEEILKMTGVPHTTVEYESQGEEAIQIKFDDDPDDSNEEGEIYLNCRGTKSDGSDCGATVKHESGFCYSHRSQWDGEIDPRFEEDYQ